MLRAFLLALLCFGLTAPATAQELLYSTPVRVCPASLEETAPPDFTADTCQTLSLWQVDPQGTHIWVEAPVTVSPSLLDPPRPLGVLISGKMSSEVWVNDRLVGSNGRPGASRTLETPGRIDAVLYLPPDVIHAGSNRIVLRLSAHHGFIRLGNPVHGLGITTYGDPTRFILTAYWPALITLSIFVIGLISFGVLAVRGEDRAGSTLLALIALFAGCQLGAETARGLVAYPYPLHDVRLLAITGFAWAFGVCLIALVTLKAARLRTAVSLAIIGATALTTLIAIVWAGGFDLKAALGLTLPVIPAIAVALWGWRQGHRQAPAWLAALAGFGLLFIVSLGWFLDRYFYLAVAGLLASLFLLQIFNLVRERRKRREGETLARQLQLSLDQARERSEPSQISLTGAGRVDRLSTAQITHLQGAGDYVEIHTEAGRPLLHSGSLAALEDSLPATFLRVHRSFIVNTAFVRSLARDPSGTGVLTLNSGAQIPVSRRIMPTVRSALSAVD